MNSKHIKLTDILKEALSTIDSDVSDVTPSVFYRNMLSELLKYINSLNTDKKTKTKIYKILTVILWIEINHRKIPSNQIINYMNNHILILHIENYIKDVNVYLKEISDYLNKMLNKNLVSDIDNLYKKTIRKMKNTTNQ